MRHVALAFSLLVATAAGASADPLPGAPARERLAGHAMVWADASLYVAPRDDAETLRLVELGTDERAAHPDATFPVSVVPGRCPDDFVEVEASNDPCGALLASTTLAHLHFWVKRADLAPVVRAAYTHTLDDGTRIAISPGAVAIATGGDRYRLGDPAGVERALPGVAVGYSFTPKSGAAGAACVTVVASDPAARSPDVSVMIPLGSGMATSGFGGNCRDGWYVPVNTPVRYHDAAIGTLADERRLAAAPTGATGCVDASLYWTGHAGKRLPAPSLEVCAPVARIHHAVPAASCPKLLGTHARPTH
jgi:hypothetical protein